MKIAACDDDSVFLQELCTFCKLYSEKNNYNLEYHTFTNPLELVTEIEKGIHYDVILLDVFMPGINGIQCAKDIRTYDNYVKIIFLTSSPEFAIESYTVKAYNYLLKPIQKDSLFLLLDQLIKESNSIKENLFVFKSKTGIVKISLSKLKYCEMINRKIILYLTDGSKYECNLRINDLEKKLEPFDMFLRPHRSFLVNMDYIQTLSLHNIIMECGAKIPIPREKYAQIKQVYMEYMFHAANLIVLNSSEKTVNTK